MKKMEESRRKIFIEDISKETKTSIGVLLILLGWLMKEGKVGDIYIKHTKAKIDVDFVGFSAGDIYQVLNDASQKTIEEILQLSPITIEATLLGLGWLMKEGKLHFENNLISLS